MHIVCTLHNALCVHCTSSGMEWIYNAWYENHTSFQNSIQHRIFAIVRGFYSFEIELFYELVHYYGVNKGRSIRVNQNQAEWKNGGSRNRGREREIVMNEACWWIIILCSILLRVCFQMNWISIFPWELSCKQTLAELLFCCYTDWRTWQIFTAHWMCVLVAGKSIHMATNKTNL